MYPSSVTPTRRIHRQSDANISPHSAPPREHSAEISQNDDDSSSLDELDDAAFDDYTPMELESMLAPRSSLSRSRTYKGRTSTRHKLIKVVNTLQSVGWSVKDFVFAWTGTKSRGSRRKHPVILHNTNIRYPHQRRDQLVTAVNDVIQSTGIGSTFEPHKFEQELQALIQTPYFGEFEHYSITDLDRVELSKATACIHQTAPNWHAFLKRLLDNQRTAAKKSYSSSESHLGTLENRVFTITYVVCHSRARQKSSFFPKTLSVYLIQNGVHRRIIDSLAGLGVCSGYDTANRTVKQIAEEAKV
jgi:hypothetical protein